MHRATVVAGVAAAWMAVAMPAAPAVETWTVFTNCTLLANAANDGDSFHVQAAGREYIFRLYFVDCPETDMQVPARVQKQADYWSVAHTDVLAAGGAAARFARRALRRPFTVHTQFKDARGQSGLPRYFALVTTRSGPLDEQLVSRGLARSYGMHRDLPDGTSGQAHASRLDAMEKAAQQARTGIWASSGTPLGRRPADDDTPSAILVLQRPVALYGTNAPSVRQGDLPRGTRVYVMDEASGGRMVKIRYRTEAGLTDGRCRRVDLSAAGVKP